MSKMPAIDGTEHLMNAIQSSVNAFVGVPRGIIQRKAEEEAEKYVVQAGISASENAIQYEMTKQQFIENFTDKMKWAI